MKRFLYLASACVFWSFEAAATLNQQITKAKDLISGDVTTAVIIGGSLFGFGHAVADSNIKRGLLIIAIGILFAFFKQWVVAGFAIG